MHYIKRFSEISIDDIDEVGCRNAVIGEVSNKLIKNGEFVPDGFVVTTAAFNHFIGYNKLDGVHARLVKKLNTKTFRNLKKIGAEARELITHARMPDDLSEAIHNAISTIFWDRDPLLSILSSPTNIRFDDLLNVPHVINIDEKEDLINKIRFCFASLYSDDAIMHRSMQKTEHAPASIAVGVMEIMPSNNGKPFLDHIFDLSETHILMHTLHEQQHNNHITGYDAWNYKLIESY